VIDRGDRHHSYPTLKCAGAVIAMMIVTEMIVGHSGDCSPRMGTTRIDGRLNLYIIESC